MTGATAWLLAQVHTQQNDMDNDNFKFDASRLSLTWSDDIGRTRFRSEVMGSSLAEYGPAYGFGVNARGRYPGRDFDDVESEMSSDWAASRGASILNWGWARHAAREAWNRISRPSSLCA